MVENEDLASKRISLDPVRQMTLRPAPSALNAAFPTATEASTNVASAAQNEPAEIQALSELIDYVRYCQQLLTLAKFSALCDFLELSESFPVEKSKAMLDLAQGIVTAHRGNH